MQNSPLLQLVESKESTSNLASSYEVGATFSFILKDLESRPLQETGKEDLRGDGHETELLANGHLTGTTRGVARKDPAQYLLYW